MFTLLLIASIAASDTCLQPLFPIGERDLLEPKKRWLEMQRLPVNDEQSILNGLGYADSTGQIPKSIELYQLVRCPYTYVGVSDLTLMALWVHTDVEFKDEAIWLAITRDGAIVDKSLIAQLQTSCSQTFLRGCRLTADSGINIQQLEHVFNCETDEYVETRRIPGFDVFFTDTGEFQVVFHDD